MRSARRELKDSSFSPSTFTTILVIFVKSSGRKLQVLACPPSPVEVAPKKRIVILLKSFSTPLMLISKNLSYFEWSSSASFGQSPIRD